MSVGGRGRGDELWYFFWNTPTSWSILYACSDFPMPLLSCTSLSKWCLPSLVPPFAQCCFLGASCSNIAACTVAYIGGCTFKRKAPFAKTSFKKGGGGGLFSRVGLVSRDYGVYLLLLDWLKVQQWMSWTWSHMNNHYYICHIMYIYFNVINQTKSLVYDIKKKECSQQIGCSSTVHKLWSVVHVNYASHT